MSNFTIHTAASAPTPSQSALQTVEQKFSFVPNLLGIMANSPATIEAFMSLSQLFGKTSLTDAEKQVVLLAVSYENDCSYCMSAHSTIATNQKVPSDVINAIRTGKPIADKKLEALRQFSKALVKSAGNDQSPLLQTSFQQFLAAGYSSVQALEVIVGMAMKELTNAVNRLAETPIDAAFQSQKWNKAA